MKTCSRCKVEQDKSCFNKRSVSSDGLHQYCKSCVRELNTGYRSKVSAEEIEKKRLYNKEYSRVFSRTLRGKAQRMFHQAKKRAAKSGIDFEIDIQFIEDALNVGVCQVTGIKFVIDQDSCERASSRDVQISPFTPSIDRIDCTKGYTKDNCQFVIYMYNTCKNTFTDEDVKFFCTTYVNKLNEEAT